jgi:hypothetical protein
MRWGCRVLHVGERERENESWRFAVASSYPLDDPVPLQVWLNGSAAAGGGPSLAYTWNKAAAAYEVAHDPASNLNDDGVNDPVVWAYRRHARYVRSAPRPTLCSHVSESEQRHEYPAPPPPLPFTTTCTALLQLPLRSLPCAPPSALQAGH